MPKIKPPYMLVWAVFLLLGMVSLSQAETLVPPQQLIKDVSDRIQQELRRIDYKVNFQEAVRIVEKHIEPHVDFDRFAALVLGKYWRTATPEQRERFKQEFKTMLIRTYATTYGEYAEWEIRFKPIRNWNPDAKKVLVRTEFVQPGGQPAEVTFRMIRHDGKWKVYDVIIEGVDLVKNYRTEFGQEIAQAGSLDALIERLAERNRQALRRNDTSGPAQPVAGA